MLYERTAKTMIVVVASVAITTAHAQEFDLDWYAVDGGGVTFSTGGPFQLGATIGQPDAGLLAGGNFELAGGFWPGVLTAGQSQCSGNERISKAACKNKRGNRKMTVKVQGGLEGDTFVVELSSGESIEGTLNRKGRGKAKFTNLPGGPGTATATFGCGAANQANYTCP